MTTTITSLKKKFGSFEALQSISLAVEKGEFIAILGPSGCGKTTLLRIIAGFEKPTSGEVHIDNILVGSKDLALPPEKRNIGMVFQSFALWPHMKVRDQVEFPLIHHVHAPDHLKENRKKRVEEVLELVGLSHLAERMPNALSGGQKQRVALARALAHQPALLLMDEPLSSLDAELREGMRREIQQIHHLTKSSIIYVTHDQGEALSMADRIVIMKDGQIEQVGTPEEIFMKPETTFVATFVGKANMVKGSWSENLFTPDDVKGTSWEGSHIAETFKREGLYPVRPEEWEIGEAPSGIKGNVSNVLYQGREIHYTIATAGDQKFQVITSIANKFQLDSTVWLHKK